MWLLGLFLFTCISSIYALTNTTDVCIRNMKSIDTFGYQHFLSCISPFIELQETNDGLSLPNGVNYFGDRMIVDNKEIPHGFGMMEYETNESYLTVFGQFDYGKLNGFGAKLDTSKNNWYIGNFTNGLMDGRGIFVQNDPMVSGKKGLPSFRFSGLWKNGSYESGRYVDYDKRIIFIGKFTPAGVPIAGQLKTTQYLYTGYVDSLFHRVSKNKKPSTIIYHNQIKVTGIFENDALNGNVVVSFLTNNKKEKPVNYQLFVKNNLITFQQKTYDFEKLCMLNKITNTNILNIGTIILTK